MKRNDFMRFQDRSDVDGPNGGNNSSETEDYEAQEVYGHAASSRRALKQHSHRAKPGENDEEENDEMNDSQMLLLN